jgi:hypothetical protein
VGDLRREAVELERGEQADNAVRNLFGRDREAVVFCNWSVGERVYATGAPIKNSPTEKAKEVLARIPSFSMSLGRTIPRWRTI